MKQILIINNSKTSIEVGSNYLIFKTDTQETVIGYRYIKELHLNKLINISVSNCLKLANCFDLFFIDRYGNILAKVVPL